MLVIVINCLRLFAVVVLLLWFCCCHGDGSDGRHVCSKYMHYYQATMLPEAISCCHSLRWEACVYKVSWQATMLVIV